MGLFFPLIVINLLSLRRQSHAAKFWNVLGIVTTISSTFLDETSVWTRNTRHNRWLTKEKWLKLWETTGCQINGNRGCITQECKRNMFLQQSPAKLNTAVWRWRPMKNIYFSFVKKAASNSVCYRLLSKYSPNGIFTFETPARDSTWDVVTQVPLNRCFT